jgi:hypothetical protein
MPTFSANLFCFLSFKYCFSVMVSILQDKKEPVNLFLHFVNFFLALIVLPW